MSAPRLYFLILLACALHPSFPSISCSAQPRQLNALPFDVRPDLFNAVFLFFPSFHLTLTDHTAHAFALGSRMRPLYLLAPKPPEPSVQYSFAETPPKQRT